MMNMMKKHLNQFTKSRQDGVAAVEFALLLIVLLMIVAGVVEFGRTFWYYDALTKGTRDGARFLSNVSLDQIGSVAGNATEPDCGATHSRTPRGIVYCAAVTANVPDFDIDDVDVLCDGVACVDNVRPEYVQVAISGYPVTIGGWIPVILPTGATTWDVAISPSTTMRYMR